MQYYGELLDKFMYNFAEVMQQNYIMDQLKSD